MKKKPFHTRSFVSFFILFNFLVMSITGIILYVTPPGRIARWTSWVFWGMGKDQLEAIHTVSSFAFLIASLFHIFLLNRNALWSYIKIRSKELTGRRVKHMKELVFALLFSVVIFIGSFMPFSPFSNIIGWGDDLKESWGDKSLEAPVSGAEKLTLEAFSQRVLKQDVGDVLKTLTTGGIKVDSGKQTLRDIARNNGISPARIYEILKTN